MERSEAILVLCALAFATPVVSGLLGGPGVGGVEALQFAVVAGACLGTRLRARLLRHKPILFALVLTLVFVFSQGLVWSVILVLSLVGRWSFSWVLPALGPLGIAAACVCFRVLELKVVCYRDPGGPGPRAPA